MPTTTVLEEGPLGFLVASPTGIPYWVSALPLTADEAFRLASLYDIDDDQEFDPYFGEAFEDYAGQDEDGSEAYARMLERRSENGTWFGRDDDWSNWEIQMGLDN